MANTFDNIPLGDGQILKSRPIGIIIPPLEIRRIADKTAEYVAINGSSFEDMLSKNEANNHRFCFLKPHDPYRPYYESKILEFASGSVEVKFGDSQEDQQLASIANIAISQSRDFRKEIKREVRPPQPDLYSVEVPKINVIDLDVIKLSAQYVARNGPKFLTQLTEKEKNNPQFDFLKPTHQFFPLFTNFVETYSRIINPNKEEIVKLQSNITQKMSILNRCGERFEYENIQMQAKKKKEEIEEEERREMAQVDWNDFVVVETIDLFDAEDLPAPTNFNEVDKFQSGQIPQTPTFGSKEQGKIQEQPNEDEVEKARKALQAQKDIQQKIPPLPQMPKPQQQQVSVQQQQEEQVLEEEMNMRIKKGYERRPNIGDVATVKCQICGQYIAVTEINEHTRIELMDPKYREIQKQLRAREDNRVTAPGDEVTANLAIFAEKRPDLFGATDELLPEENEKLQQNSNNELKTIWDGTQQGMSRTTANFAMLAQQTKRNIDETTKALQTNTLKKDVGNLLPTPKLNLPTLTAGPINIVPINPMIPKGPINLPKPGLIPQSLIPPPPNSAAPNQNIIPSPPQALIDNEASPQSQPKDSPEIETQVEVQDQLENQNLTQQQNQTTNTSATNFPKLKPEEFVKEGNIQLYPENIWMQMHPGPLTINVKVTEAIIEEGYKIQSQYIPIQIEQTTLISDVKENLSQYLGCMPANKMKLKTQILPQLKDNSSFAYYNFRNGSVIDLTVKEKGGKKKK